LGKPDTLETHGWHITSGIRQAPVAEIASDPHAVPNCEYLPETASSFDKEPTDLILLHENVGDGTHVYAE